MDLNISRTTNLDEIARKTEHVATALSDWANVNARFSAELDTNLTERETQWRKMQLEMEKRSKVMYFRDMYTYAYTWRNIYSLVNVCVYVHEQNAFDDV